MQCSHSDVLRKVIVEQISNMMVLPNKLPIVLSETVPAVAIKLPEPEVIPNLFFIRRIVRSYRDDDEKFS